MDVTIISDTICPWCYVGKRRFERALSSRDNVEVNIEWRAFQLNPDMPAEGMDRHKYMVRKFGSPERVKEIFDAITAAGNGVGISFAFDKIARTPNTVGSHRLIAMAGANGRQDAVVEVLFRRYFEDAEDIGDLDVLVDAGVEAGLDAEGLRRYLESQEGAEAVLRENEAAHKVGISGVPCFIFDNKYAVSGAQEAEIFQQVFDMSDKQADTVEGPPA